jgi:acetate kinase
MLPLRHLLTRRSAHTLTLNAGSSSLKMSLFDSPPYPSPPSLLSEATVDRVGKDDAVVKVNNETVFTGPIRDHEKGLAEVVANLDITSVTKVGHRVVHGGSAFTEPTVITPEVLSQIEAYNVLAPLHNPPALSGIRAAQSILPDAAHVAVFDTAFHATIGPEAYRYGLPKSTYTDFGFRRYGFHGTSFKYVTGYVAEYLDKPAPNLVIMHLGSGASMCCVKEGKSVDTTMGMSTIEGLIMGTRAGDTDPGMVTALIKEHGMSADDVDEMMNKQSGLLGVSGGYSNDMRLIKEKAREGDEDCKLARSMFVERVRKYVGAYTVKLNGQVDACEYNILSCC